jgi:hypothetical protein
MSQGIAYLHKILKDETRKKIVLLLNEKGSLSYTQLLEETEVGSTGLLNYHLKSLGDLIVKNETGQYLLSEKGKLASKLLIEFPEDYSVQSRKRKKQFWIAIAISQVVYLVTVITLYNFSLLNLGIVISSAVWVVGAILLAYLGYKLQSKPKPQVGSNEERKKFQVLYIGLGAVIGVVIAFFGTPIISYISVVLGGSNLLRLIDYHIPEYVTILFLSTLIGGFLGYNLGKRNCFQQPKWGKWLEEHFNYL